MIRRFDLEERETCLRGFAGDLRAVYEKERFAGG